MIDVVYPYKATRDDAELRHSLRSLVNLSLAIRHVWIIGDLPPWATGIRHLPGNRHGSKPRNVFGNIRLAAECADMTDEIVVMNDDFYIISPTSVPVQYRSTLAEHIASLRTRQSPWLRSLHAARSWLEKQGITEPLSYELHQPIIVRRSIMAEVLKLCAEVNRSAPPQWRTVYGNWGHIGGDRAAEDCKVYRSNTELPIGPFVSTSDAGWARSGHLIRALFPDPSRWEKRCS